MKKVTRREKAQAGAPRKQAPKQQWTESYGINTFNLTESQRQLANKIKDNDLVFCTGPAGTGKSLGVLHTFVKEYLADNTKQIIVIRTPVEAGMDKVGALPDSLDAKIEPHFASSRNLLEQLLSKGKVETDLNHRIHFKIPNYCLGATFDSAYIMIDECFTDKHEFLTKDGWKNVALINESDYVAQYNDDGSFEFVKPIRVIHKEYEGDIIEYFVGNVSYSVTANHRMIYKNSSDELIVKLAKDSSANNWNFISSCITNNENYNISDEHIKMVVALQADGSYTERPLKPNWGAQFSKQRKIERFNNINSELGLPFSSVKDNKDKKRYYSSKFSTTLLCGKQKDFDFDKIMMFSQRQKELFIKELAYWDGSFYDESENFLYSTTNKHNVDVVQAVASTCGYVTTVSAREDNRKESYKTSYKVMIRKQTYSTTQKHDSNKVQRYYKGMVHCVQVPNSMLLTRCNNRVHVSGNCQQLPPLILKLLLERTGINSKVVVLGDNSQLYVDSRGRNALLDAVPRFFDVNNQHKPKYDYVALHEFDVEDVQRSDIVKSVIRAYSS